MKRIHPWTAAFAVATVAWAVALPAAAAARGTSRVDGPAPIASRLVYAAGAVICHQRPERSFRLAGEPLPVCARCAGIYGGAALAVLALGAAALIGGPRERREVPAPDRFAVRSAAVAAAIPTALTLAWEWAIGNPPSNVLRAVAGLPIGLFVAWVVMVAIRRDVQSG